MTLEAEKDERKEGPWNPVSVRFEPEEWAWLGVEAAKRRTSRSGLLRELVAREREAKQAMDERSGV